MTNYFYSVNKFQYNRFKSIPFFNEKQQKKPFQYNWRKNCFQSKFFSEYFEKLK